MSEKYKDVRAKDMYVGTSGGELRVTKESQLDRVEKKVDRILHILENGELSTSINLDAESLKKVTQDLDDRYNESLRKCGLN